MSLKMFTTLIFVALQVISGLATPIVTPDSTSDVVNTPAGPIPRANVFAIPDGGKVDVNATFIRLLDGNGKVIHSAPRSGQVGKPLKGFTQAASTPPGPAAFGSGYVSSAAWGNPNAGSKPIALFQTTWTVPAVPSTVHGQLLYYFNGIEPADFSSILQPVLQFGVSPAGGGNYWSVASWYVSNAATYYTTPVQVSPGQSLQGVMTLNSIVYANGVPFQWNYNSIFSGISGSSLNVALPSELTLAWEALEIYGATAKTDLPHGRTKMTGINIYASDSSRPAVSWGRQWVDTADGFDVAIVTNSGINGEVDFIYPLQ